MGSAELATGAVTTAKIGDSQVTGPKLADGAVTVAKLAPGGVGSAQIADGSIALADLSPAALAALQLDVADEGAVVAADPGTLNFVGAGVQVTAAGGVATIAIAGVPASAILPGTIAEWYDVTPPAGGTCATARCTPTWPAPSAPGTGPAAGTVPNFEPTPVDSYTTTVSNIVASNLPGWRCDSATARISHGQVTLQWQITRTGATISLSNPNHSDQAAITIKAPYIPEFSIGGSCNNQVRSFYISSSQRQHRLHRRYGRRQRRPVRHHQGRRVRGDPELPGPPDQLAAQGLQDHQGRLIIG